MSTRMILVAREGDAKQAYLDAIKTLEVHVDTVSSFSELYKALLNTPYHGVMVDLLTKLRAPKEEQGLVHEILELFPVVQLNWEGKAEKIRTLYFGQSIGGGTIEDFICEECRSFNARTIRSHLRRNINFNVVLSKNGKFSEKNNAKTVTIDVSRGGCFIYTIDEWERNIDSWLQLKELDDSTPILGEVKWRIPWGSTMKIPGIGVKFKEISEVQLEEICEKYHL